MTISDRWFQFYHGALWWHVRRKLHGDYIYPKLVHRLPRNLVLWCFIMVHAHADDSGDSYSRCYKCWDAATKAGWRARRAYAQWQKQRTRERNFVATCEQAGYDKPGDVRG